MGVINFNKQSSFFGPPCTVVFYCFWLSVPMHCLERLVSKMTYYVLSGTLNPTQSLTLYKVSQSVL